MQHNIPWLLMGDFNEILYNHEKEGGNPRPRRYMQEFQECLHDCELEDVGYVGDKFTWRRGRIRERLDRGVASNDWSLMFLDAAVIHMGFADSDHRPLLLDTMYYRDGREVGQTHKPRFEARWLQEPTFSEAVGEAWTVARQHAAGDRILSKLSRLHEGLHAWDWFILKLPMKKLRKKQKQLEWVMRAPMTDANEKKKRG